MQILDSGHRYNLSALIERQTNRRVGNASYSTERQENDEGGGREEKHQLERLMINNGRMYSIEEFVLCLRQWNKGLHMRL